MGIGLYNILKLRMMPKTWPLCTGVKLNLRDRVLGEVEKNSFIDLPGKGGTQQPHASKTVCPNPGGFGEEFYSNGSRAELLTRIRVCAGPALLNLASGGLLVSFSSFFDLASGGLLPCLCIPSLP